MILPDQPPQIPAPFNDLSGFMKHSDEAKGVDPVDRQSGKHDVRNGRCSGCACRFYDLAPAYDVTTNSCLDGIPVNESKGRSAVIQRDPRPAAGFGRTEHGATV